MSQFNALASNMFHDCRQNRYKIVPIVKRPVVPDMSQKTYVPRGTPAPFLVMEPNPIIAADLAQSIGECPGGGPTVTVRDRAGAETELSQPGPRLAVFLPAETEIQRQTVIAMEPLIRVHGAAVVAMSGTLTQDDADARGWLLLPLPFTPAMVHAVIGSLARS